MLLVTDLCSAIRSHHTMMRNGIWNSMVTTPVNWIFARSLSFSKEQVTHCTGDKLLLRGTMNWYRPTSFHAMWHVLLWLVIPATHSLALNAVWTAKSGAQRIAPRRSGHTSFGCLDELYVFGGYAEEDGPKRYVVNDLWKWSRDGDGAWVTVEQAGDIPRSRLVAAGTITGNKAYLFGGWDPGTEGTGGDILNDVHELDLATHSWKKLDCALPDGPSSRHVALTIGKTIVLHNHRCNNHLWVFNVRDQSFIKQPTTGPCPSSRGLHCAVVVGPDKAVFFGGAAQDGSMSNEAFMLQTDTWTWERLAPLPDDAPGRAASCLCKLNESCVLMFGGAESSTFGLKPRGDLWALHLDSNQWEQILKDNGEEGGISPPPRNAASLAMVAGGQFLLTGGWAPFHQTWDDCFVLNVSS